MIEDVGTTSLVRWIVGLPLLAAAVQALLVFFARKAVRRFWVVSLVLVPLLLAFCFVAAAFVELVDLPPETRLMNDGLWSWIGVGVGSEVFDAELAFRIDSLSAVLGLIYVTVAISVSGYALASMHSDPRGDAGYQRFFVFFGLTFSSLLVFLFAADVVMLLAGWMGCGVGTAWLTGFWYSEEGSRRVATRSIVFSLLVDGVLLLGVVVLYWALTVTGPHGLDFGAIERSMPSLDRERIMLPFGIEVRTLALVAVCVAFSACARAAQFPFTIGASGIARSPAPAAAMALSTTSLGIVLCSRLSFAIDASPMTAAALAWIGAISAVVGAAIALAQRDLVSILVAASISQFGVGFIAIGCGAYSAAVFLVSMTVVVFSLLVLCAGSVIHTLDGERDIRRMGGLNVRLVLTHLMALVGVFSPALFLAREQALAVLFETETIPGAGAIFAFGLVGTGLVSWAISRFLIDVFWGSIRTPLGFRGEFNDPALPLMLPLYGLAFVSTLGAAMNPAQIWGDLLPGGVEGSDSLTRFLAVMFEPEVHEGLDPASRWQLVFASMFATVLGFAITYLFFVRFPRARAQLNRRLIRLQRLLAGRSVGRSLDRTLGAPLEAASGFWLEVSAGRVFVGVRRHVGAPLLALSRRWLTGLHRAERGLPDLSLLLAMLGAIVLLRVVLP